MADSEGVQVRPARIDDAEPLAHLHVDVWEDAYQHLMPAEVFAERRTTTDRRIERWRVALAEGPSTTIVAETAGGLIGFATIGPSRDEDVEVDEELWALYVRAAWWGRRIGHALLTSVLGDRPAYVWALRGNDRAITFYRAHGFAEDGITRSEEHGTEVRLVRRP